MKFTSARSSIATVFFMLNKNVRSSEAMQINLFFLLLLSFYWFERYVPPPLPVKKFLSLLVKMYICKYSKYCRRCVLCRTGLGIVESMCVGVRSGGRWWGSADPELERK